MDLILALQVFTSGVLMMFCPAQAGWALGVFMDLA
jgi:hypothetical protein